ncbi:ferredoxin domain-containing protein [bacterium]
METLKTIAEMIMIAARTAPKAKGCDNIVTRMLNGDEKKKIADKMDEISIEYDHKGFKRDAQNVRDADIVVLIGTKTQRLQLKVCGLCGAANCADSEKKNYMCIFNPGDLGIAVGSAVSKAADFRVDNRIMYTAGYASQKLGFVDEHVKIVYAIPLSVSGKNIFFDRI